MTNHMETTPKRALDELEINHHDGHDHHDHHDHHDPHDHYSNDDLHYLVCFKEIVHHQEL